MVFKATLDPWLTIVTLGAIAVCAWPFFLEGHVQALLIALVLAAFVSYISGKTQYIVTADTLFLKSAFFTKRIPIQMIYQVTKTNYPTATPTRIVERLELYYSPNMQMAILSPRDCSAFIDCLLEKNKAIRVVEERFKE